MEIKLAKPTTTLSETFIFLDVPKLKTPTYFKTEKIIRMVKWKRLSLTRHNFSLRFLLG